MDSYVYLHRRAGEVFYVGLGQNERITDRKSRNPWHLAVWDKSLEEGTFTCEKVYEGDRTSCSEEEIRLIAYYPNLCNLTEGGDGGNTWVGDCEQRRENVRNKMKELWKDETYRKSHREGMKSEKVSLGQKKRFSNAEAREAHSLATQKAHLPEEVKKSYGVSNKGRAWWHHPVTLEEWLGKGEPPSHFVKGRAKARWKGVGGRPPLSK